LYQWLFRDADHPILKEFFVFPIDISTTFRSFNEFKVDMNVFARTLHKFCMNHYTELYKRFIFYIENIGGRHWILHVAVNPFATLTGFLYPNEAVEFEHGVFTYDPFGKQRELGCERQLIFLLNAMSYYRDLAIHGILSQATAPSTWEQIWIMGGRGPFGCYTDPGMMPNQEEFDKFMGTLSPFKPKKFIDETGLILMQTDGFNCGLLCILFIWDFVMTQWRRPYTTEDLHEFRKFSGGLGTTITLPKDYCLGSTFPQLAKKYTKLKGYKICKLVRLEILCLMERLHSLYYTAYSREDKVVPKKIGVLSEHYNECIQSSPILKKAKEEFLVPIL
jgi:hypothetical protein